MKTKNRKTFSLTDWGYLPKRIFSVPSIQSVHGNSKGKFLGNVYQEDGEKSVRNTETKTKNIPIFMLWT